MTDQWLALYESYGMYKSDQSRIMLEMLFAEPMILKTIGAAKQMRHIKGKAPEGTGIPLLWIAS